MVPSTLTATDAALRVAGITKTYPVAGTCERFCVLDDISFEVAKGELVSVIGPSGCGKTTLLKIVHGLTPADGGDVFVGTTRVAGTSNSFGMVFQDSRLLPWKTVQQNVEFALELKHHRRPTREEKEIAREYIEAVGLGKFAQSYPHQLSGGMQQRTGVARALTKSPDIMLLDEPFGALDAQTRLVMQDLFLTLQQRFEITALLVTHDIDEAVYMSQRCIALGRTPGRVKRDLVVGLPVPRHKSDTRANPEFTQYRSTLWDLLRSDAIEASSDG